MKRSQVSLLLVLCMITVLMIPAWTVKSETANPADIHLPENAKVCSLVFIQNSLLVLTSEGLYSIKTDDGKLAPVFFPGMPENGFLLLASQDDALWGLDTMAQTIYPLELKQGNLKARSPVDIPLNQLLEESLLGAESAPYPDQALIFGNDLCLLYTRDEPQGFSKVLLSFDLKTGHGKLHQADIVQSLAIHPQKGLLAVTQDNLNAYNPEGAGMLPSYLQVFDLQTDAFTEECMIQTQERLQHLSVSKDTDQIYLSTWDKVYRMEEDNSLTMCAHTGFINEFVPVGGMLILPGQLAALPKTGLIQMCSVNPDHLPAGRLVVFADGLGYGLNTAISALNPAMVDVQGMLPYRSSAEIAEAFVTNTLAADVILLQSEGFDLDSLKEKGYCYPLSDSPLLAEYVQRLQPSLQDLAKLDSQLLMLPVELYGEIPGYYPDLFEETGAPIPETFDEFMLLLESWQDKYAVNFPDYVPFKSFDPLQEVLMLVMNLYANQCEYTGEAFGFDSPSLYQMLERMDQFFDKNKQAFLSGTPLMKLRSSNFGPSMRLNGFEDRTGLRPMPLKPREDIPFAAYMDAWVLMIPHTSQNPGLAMRFLEEYTKAMDQEVLAKLMPDMNEKIEDFNFRVTWDLMDKRLEDMRRLAEKAKGVNKSQAENEVAQYIDHMNQYALENRYIATPETIAQYRDLTQKLCLRRFGQPEGFFVFNNSPAIRLLL